jgi:hypothetical protein
MIINIRIFGLTFRNKRRIELDKMRRESCLAYIEARSELNESDKTFIRTEFRDSPGVNRTIRILARSLID